MSRSSWHDKPPSHLYHLHLALTTTHYYYLPRTTTTTTTTWQTTISSLSILQYWLLNCPLSKPPGMSSTVCWIYIQHTVLLIWSPCSLGQLLFNWDRCHRKSIWHKIAQEGILFISSSPGASGLENKTGMGWKTDLAWRGGQDWHGMEDWLSLAWRTRLARDGRLT